MCEFIKDAISNKYIQNTGSTTDSMLFPSAFSGAQAYLAQPLCLSRALHLDQEVGAEEVHLRRLRTLWHRCWTLPTGSPLAPQEKSRPLCRALLRLALRRLATRLLSFGYCSWSASEITGVPATGKDLAASPPANWYAKAPLGHTTPELTNSLGLSHAKWLAPFRSKASSVTS